MKTRIVFLLFSLLLIPSVLFSQEKTAKSPKAKQVLQINLRKEVNSISWMEISKGLEEARIKKYDAVLINMNTYGGEVLYADSIRTAILNAPMPVYVFINNNAASAGALISIACDKIFMRSSGTIGASTVVDQSGAAAPDKYQSYMRGIIRATAEAQGKDTTITGQDTTIAWHRNPKIAEAMVDEDIHIAGIIDSGKVLTFTANEALQNGYCDGISENVDEILTKYVGYSDYDLTVFRMKGWDYAKGQLMGTALRAILIMLIVGGIWFELQAPGIGFPTLVAVVAAVFYFAPLYIDGLAQNWEIILFIIGMILLFMEVFVIPGFGVAGILGILFILCGLTFALIDNATFHFSLQGLDGVTEPLLLVSLSIIAAVLICLWLSTKIGHGNGVFRKLALTSVQNNEEGYIGVPMETKDMVGKTGVTDTVLRLSGKVRIGDKMYDAISEYGFIEKGENVRVTRYESGQIYVTKIIEESPQNTD
ncbi:MAG: NfeD family protein [Bacteroidales bacterium]|nr:NfeD family protein [Bacteroidales bacterium]MDD3908245.1 NfeD family protein [Bacteroidales bacterium]MDD4713270.1 NfeD family protein [Bacteroidales bacterium]